MVWLTLNAGSSDDGFLKNRSLKDSFLNDGTLKDGFVNDGSERQWSDSER